MIMRLINDCHEFGPHALLGSSDRIFEAITKSPYPVAGLGDNFDIKNAKKKEVEIAKIHVLRAANLAYMRNVELGFTSLPPQSLGEFWLDGNHEIGFGTGTYTLKVGDTFMTHGHIPQWSREKVHEWEEKEAGAGWLKRNLLVKSVAAFRHLVPITLPESVIEWIEANFTILPKRIYMGHKHPKEITVFKYKSCEIIYLPRGINDVEVV
jgi:hypothetical protein